MLRMFLAGGWGEVMGGGVSEDVWISVDDEGVRGLLRGANLAGELRGACVA